MELTFATNYSITVIFFATVMLCAFNYLKLADKVFPYIL